MTDTTPTPRSTDESGAGNAPTASPTGLRIGALTLILLLSGVVALFAFRRNSSVANDATERTVAVGKGATVKIATVDSSPSARHLVLLGEARPYESVTLYAKVSGYLRDVRVDKGSHVGAGDVIATIESPETDRAYAGAKAEYDNKMQIAKRVTQLRAKNFVSAQEAEQAEADAAIAGERLGALQEQRAYETLKAPFAGTVTARFADPGALMQSAATSQTSALPVATVSQTNRLRVMVYLDQGDASAVRAGTRATISLDERPAFHLTAKVARVSGELDAKSRKMLAEIDVPNQDGAIVPGGFVRVTLDLAQPSLPQAPTEALIVRKSGTFVAVVGTNGYARLRPVQVAANDGRTVTFLSGVRTGEKVALSLGAGSGDSVQVQGAR
jgi:RND family efflux transporter MFP subunit